jgi:hypothetical protein
VKLERDIKRGYHLLDYNFLVENQLHLARYKGNSKDGSSDGVIVYRVFKEEKMVVYSGLNDAGLSTINATDRILASLVEEDASIDLKSFRFFDIQTIRGYEYISRGKFDITEIKFLGDGEERLMPRIKPSELPEVFRPILPILSNR